MLREEKIGQKKEKSCSPPRKTNYKIGFFADSKTIDEASLKTILHTFFPYHLICANNKIEKLVRRIAVDYVCQVTDVLGDTTEEVFSEIIRNSPDILFVVWDGEGHDGVEFLRLSYKHKIDTYVYYAR